MPLDCVLPAPDDAASPPPRPLAEVALAWALSTTLTRVAAVPAEEVLTPALAEGGCACVGCTRPLLCGMCVAEEEEEEALEREEEERR